MKKMLEIFKQVKVIIPLLDIIQQIPTHANFLKVLCTQKRNIHVPKEFFLAPGLSEILSQSIPIKYKDLGCPISCTIGDKTINKCLLDLGASVNLILYSVYQLHGLGELKLAKVTLQFVDCSIKKLMGEIEYVVIKTDHFIFPIDFIILESTPVNNPMSQIPLILGRPFSAISNALNNCRNGSMKISFGNITMDLTFSVLKISRTNNMIRRCKLASFKKISITKQLT